MTGVHLLAVSSRGELAVLTKARYLGHSLFDGTLARMPLEGGAPREVLEGVREADWSPDGNELAIIRDVGGRDRLEYPIGKVLCEAGGYLSDLRVSPKGIGSPSSSTRSSTTTAGSSRWWTSPARRQFSPTATGGRRVSPGRRTGAR